MIHQIWMSILTSRSFDRCSCSINASAMADWMFRSNRSITSAIGGDRSDHWERHMQIQEIMRNEQRVALIGFAWDISNMINCFIKCQDSMSVESASVLMNFSGVFERVFFLLAPVVASWQSRLLGMMM